MSSGDSHTGFDAGAFTVGALGGAVSIAGALAAGWTAHRAAQQDRWSDWTIEQLRRALDCSEAMRYSQFGDLQRALKENAALKRAAQDRAFIVKREQARSLQARR